MITDEFEGQCWTQEVQWPDDTRPEAWGINCYKTDTSAAGLSKEPGKIHTGMNSGYAALNHAYHLGAERVILLGYDMQMENDRRHWFGAHPDGMEVASNYGNFIARFQTVRPADYGMEVWNCTRRTALRCFPVYDLDDVCAALL